MILITGGTGHLGTELVPLLVGHGHSVRVLTRGPGRARRLLGPEVELAQGDVRDPASLAAALEGAIAVISAVTGFGPGGGGPRLIDGEGNLNLIRAAESAGVGHFVLLSMVGAAADHPLELLRMKRRAEEALQASRLEWTIVRPTVFMELWAGIIGDPILARGRATVLGRGDNPVNFISARDIARFVELALRDPRLRQRAIDIGGPENLTFNQVVEAIEAASGRKATVSHAPLVALRLASKLLRPFRPDLAGMIGAALLTDTRDMTFDPTQLQRDYPEIELTLLSEVVSRAVRQDVAAAHR
jgi:uncharacterized protein YbjT (DUF2867 family)